MQLGIQAPAVQLVLQHAFSFFVRPASCGEKKRMTDEIPLAQRGGKLLVMRLASLWCQRALL